MSTASPNSAGLMVLRERAHALVLERGQVAEDELLAHVYGAAVSDSLAGLLRAPLSADSRLTRLADGTWTLAAKARPQSGPGSVAFTALVVVADGPRPGRSAVLAVAARAVEPNREPVDFSVHFRPRRRVPRYVAERLGLDPETLREAPTFADTVDDFVAFLGARQVLAQEAELGWRFLASEARSAGRTLPDVDLLDLNQLAARVLGLEGKPTLDRILSAAGVPRQPGASPEQQVRAVARAGERLLLRASEEALASARARPGPLAAGPLRDARTASALPAQAGVYVLNGEEGALYVGKARRLRERVAAYVHRPLGPTRRLEGLAEATTRVDAELCDTDLEALVLEERRIRELQPRFNTQRLLRPARRWIRLPPEPEPRRSRPLAPPRLELCTTPSARGEHLGPFRNARLAAQARDLARELFGLDAARRSLPREAYRTMLEGAWRFLLGDSKLGVRAARDALADATARRDFDAARRWRRLLGAATSWEPSTCVLPFDPLESRVALLRASPDGGLEAFVLDCCVLVGRETCEMVDAGGLGRRLLADLTPRTTPADAELALRWLGAQRPTARLVPLPAEPELAIAAVDAAAAALAEVLLATARR